MTDTNAKNSGKKRSGIKKKIAFILSLAVNIIIVAYIALQEFGMAAEPDPAPVRDLNMAYLLLAIGCFLVSVLMETCKYQSMMMATDGRVDLRGAFECAVLGKYYDNVTPLGAGGQPFQMYYLKKRGLSKGSSAALPVAGFLSLQTAFIMIALVVFIFNGSVADEVAAIRISAYVGLGFYMFVPLCIVLFTVMPNSFAKVVCAVAKPLHKLRIIKDYDRAVNSIYSSLNEYSTSLNLLRHDPALLIKLMVFSLIYQVAVMSIPFFVLWAFGGSNSWWTVFSQVVFIYAAITIVPTPGNAGAAEGSFYMVFSSLSQGFLFWGMMIWRVLVYYCWLAMGLILMATMRFSDKKRRDLPPNAPLRAAQFVDVFYPTTDEVVRTVDSYARRMSADGSCCVVAPRAASSFDDGELPYPVLRAPALRLGGFFYMLPLPGMSRRLKRFFKEEHFDVFHAHSPFQMGRFAVRMGRKLGVPIVATFHSKFYDDVLGITHSKLIARLVVRDVVRFYRKVDEVWACSAGTADTLRSYGYKGEIHVMDNGVNGFDCAQADALRSRAMTELHLPSNRHLLVFAGQLIWQNGLKVILDTVKKLDPNGERFAAVIVGQGYNGGEIRAYADKLGLDRSVIFTGCIRDPALLRGVFLCAKLFFFPSLYDNAPLVVREAAQMGLPSLLSEGSNAAEVVTDGVNGFTAANNCDAMAEKIEAILASADLGAVGEKARETIPVLWDVIVVRVQERYRALIARLDAALKE